MGKTRIKLASTKTAGIIRGKRVPVHAGKTSSVDLLGAPNRIE